MTYTFEYFKTCIVSLMQTASLNYLGFAVQKKISTTNLDNFFSLVKVKPIGTKLIRLGGENDGGYIVPDDLSGIEECFSPGVFDITTFEDELVSRNIKCYLCDNTVESLSIKNSLIDFEKKHIGGINSNEYMRFDDWVEKKSTSNSDLILQMDIEGAEYLAILDTNITLLKRFRILIIEFHGLNAIYSPMGFDLIFAAFEKISSEFTLVHAHPNNCGPIMGPKGYQTTKIMEMTFLRNDRVNIKGSLKFPNELDRPNVTTNSEITLPSNWYKEADEKSI